MEHIKHILAARKAFLFAARGGTGEKGSREWSAFNSVRGDTTDIFPVAPMRMHHSEKSPARAQQYSRQLRLQFGGGH